MKPTRFSFAATAAIGLGLAISANAADIYKVNNSTNLNDVTSWSTTSGSQTPNPGSLGTDN